MNDLKSGHKIAFIHSQDLKFICVCLRLSALHLRLTGSIELCNASLVNTKP